jgi:hypothetical protein
MLNFAIHFLAITMNILHFRVLIDHSDKVFRDIHIRRTSNFLDLHNAIMKAFAFSGMEMASFYMSNEDWDKGEEIALMDIMADPGDDPVRMMNETIINELIENKGDKMLYVYDFMRMWIFYIELIEVSDENPDLVYPVVALSAGTAPAEDSKTEAASMQIDMEEGSELFESEEDDDFDSYDDQYY